MAMKLVRRPKDRHELFLFILHSERQLIQISSNRNYYIKTKKYNCIYDNDKHESNLLLQ